MSTVESKLFTDPAHLAKLKSDVRAGATDSLREVARQFESMFTHMLMKNMRAASLGEGAFDSDQSKFYQDMFDQQMSTELTQGEGLGIADLLVQQLGGSDTVKPIPSFPINLPIPRNNRIDSPVTTAASPLEKSPIKDPADFVRQLLPHAKRIGEALSIAPQLILAQAALETGWGQKMIRNADGSDSHNLFGIKAGANWSGPKAVVNTLEFAVGVGRRVTAAFRSYTSIGDSFDDYAALLSNSARYKDVPGSGQDGAAFAGALKRGGYATDPHYDSKIMTIADGETLKNAMKLTAQTEQ